MWLYSVRHDSSSLLVAPCEGMKRFSFSFITHQYRFSFRSNALSSHRREEGIGRLEGLLLLSGLNQIGEEGVSLFGLDQINYSIKTWILFAFGLNRTVFLKLKYIGIMFLSLHYSH